MRALSETGREGPPSTAHNARFGIGPYLQTLLAVLVSPSRLFADLPRAPDLRPPLVFLVLCSLFHAGASLTCTPEGSLLGAGILFLNALLMPLIAAALGRVIAVMVRGRRPGFLRFFQVYAYAAGATLMVSWVPFSLWLTEPWKWVLIGIGLIKNCELRPGQALTIILISVAVLTALFGLLAPLVLQIRTSLVG